MSIITPIANLPIQDLSINKPAVNDDINVLEKKQDETPVINKMSQRLNDKEPLGQTDNVSQANVQKFMPDASVAMMGAQSGNITAEFVANLLNKSPYES